MVRVASPSAPRRRKAPAVVLVGVCALVAGCTRTTDLAANVQLDASTTTLRIPVYRVPRTTTTVEAPTTVPDASDSSTTTAPAAPATPAAPGPETGGLGGLAALVGAVQRATAPVPGTRPAPARPPATPTTTTPPGPTTSTTVIPTPPQAIVIAATNAQAHPGETQRIDISIDGHRVGTVACGGRDYQLTPAGWIYAGFATGSDCPVDATGPTLRRTLPASIAPGQYAFCTEIDPDSPTTVCTAYTVIPYPT